MKTCSIWFVMTFSIFGQECCGTLTAVPINTVVYEGNETVLQCRTNATTANASKLLWRTQSSEHNTSVTLHTGSKFAANVSKSLYGIINTTKEQLDLRIEAYNTTAKRYICEEPGASNASAELIVLVSDPVCNSTVDSATNLQMQCRLEYAGNWPPVMEWRQVSGEVENETKLLTRGITNSTSKFTVVSTLTVQRNETRSKYLCTTKFKADGRPRLTNATNIPEYSFNWTYHDDAIYTSRTTAESSFGQQLSTDKDIPTTATATQVDKSEVDVLKPVLIFLITLCTLLVITACITYKKVDAGCKSKPRDSTTNQDRADTITSLSSAVGVEERRIGQSPRAIDGGEDNAYDLVQSWRGTNYLQLYPGSVASLPLANPEEGPEPPRSPRYIGDDGTVYMELNGFQRQPATAPQTHPTTNNSVIYARIDHTVSPPPRRL